MLSKCLSYIFFLALFGCAKSEALQSKEVLLYVENSCYAAIKIYKDTNQVYNIYYDCRYSRLLNLPLNQGTYTVIANNGFGQNTSLVFVKSAYAQSLTINF